MDLITIGRQAKKASRSLIRLNTQEKNQVLHTLATRLELRKESIFQANQQDINYAKKIGIKESMIERLTISNTTIDNIVKSLENVIMLDDPINKTLWEANRPNGLLIQKKSVPLGVIAIIYESRPNVTIDAFALTFKTNNAVVLKGGKEAINSNQILVSIIQEVLMDYQINPYSIQLFTPESRDETKALMRCNKYIDVLIPRGSANLINTVLKESTVPVIETGAGNCHIYVDKEVDIEQALDIAYNAKISRPSVCNSCETILVHKDSAKEFLSKLSIQFRGKVQILGDEETMSYIDYATKALEKDYYEEFNDYIVSIKVIDSLDEAIDHINQYSTSHSEAIITKSIDSADKFLQEVDSSTVYHNASTRFTDGFEFGFGAEIGISTQKLHVRGPMGLETLTSYKYVVKGNGQIR